MSRLLLPPTSRTSPASLVLVEVLVRSLVQRLPIVARRPGRDPDADVDALGHRCAHRAVRDRATEAQRDVARTCKVRLGHRHRKLVTTHSRANVRGPDDALELLSHQPQSLVAGPVAETVVEALEVV